LRIVTQALVTVVAATLTFAAGSVVTALAQEENEADGGIEAVRTLSCSGDQPIFWSHHGDYPKGAEAPTYSTPEAALGARLEELRDDLEAADFTRAAEEPNEVQMTIELNGRQATAYAVKVDGRWKLMDFAVCDGFTA